MNTLEKNLKKGKQAEESFMQLLNNDGASYLYLRIDQKMGEKSKALTKRPDFLVNIPQFGAFLFDVKNREKQGFPDSVNKDKYHSIDPKDLEELYHLQQETLLPVWVAFLDGPKETLHFSLSPIADIYGFYLKLIKGLAKEDIKSIRIPSELVLSSFNGEFNINYGTKKISNETVEKFIGWYRAYQKQKNHEKEIQNN